jgi:hypothetical protein
VYVASGLFYMSLDAKGPQAEGEPEIFSTESVATPILGNAVRDVRISFSIA